MQEGRHWSRAFLESALRFWEELEGEGARYGFPPPLEGRAFSMTPTALQLVFMEEGFPLNPNPLDIPGRTYELLCSAVQKFKAMPPWPQS